MQTGLFNRPYFMDVLESAVEQSHEDGKSRALLYLEPDNFRKIKENVGLTGVDVVLNGNSVFTGISFPVFANVLLAGILWPAE